MKFKWSWLFADLHYNDKVFSLICLLVLWYHNAAKFSGLTEEFKMYKCPLFCHYFWWFLIPIPSDLLVMLSRLCCPEFYFFVIIWRILHVFTVVKMWLFFYNRVRLVIQLMKVKKDKTGQIPFCYSMKAKTTTIIHRVQLV